MNGKSSFNYLDLVGAVVEQHQINGVQRNCICIPVEWNGISVVGEPGNFKGAYQNLREWETSQKYKEACMANNTDKPDYVAPSHIIEVSYPEALEASYKKRHEELVRKDEKFMATNPSEEDIKKETNYRYRKQLRVGFVTPLKRVEPKEFTGAAPIGVSGGAYVPPPAEVNPDDDLPF